MLSRERQMLSRTAVDTPYPQLSEHRGRRQTHATMHLYVLYRSPWDEVSEEGIQDTVKEWGETRGKGKGREGMAEASMSECMLLSWGKVRPVSFTTQVKNQTACLIYPNT